MKHPEYDPQKALLVDEPPAGDRWVHELKLDGFRMGVVLRGKSVEIISRRGTVYTNEYPEIVEAARKLRARSALLDGEVVVLDERGVSNFQRLQQLAESRKGLTYFAFDLLELNGEDLRPLPLLERKRRLKKLLGARNGLLRYSEHFDASGGDVFAQACALGAEGIVSKRRDAPYQSGARSADWQKTKCLMRQEFVVGGFTDPEGSRAGVGSILIGYYEGGSLRFAGKVGTGPGWNAKFSRALRERLERIETDASPFHPLPKGWLGKHAHWVKPRLVVEVQFSEWTNDGSARHPSLQGFRKDKKPTEVVREMEAHPTGAAHPAHPAHPAAAAESVHSVAGVASGPAARDSRIVFPRARLGTADLVGLYAEIMEWALPHAEGRPLTLVRMRQPITREDALRSQAVFVHHTARDQRFVPASVPRMRIAEQKKVGEYCYVDSGDALLALIGAGVVEWHVWNARVDDVEHPDRVVFDIDPGEGVPWKAVVDAARRLRRLLQAYDLESWVKTTGGKGLHVVVPFRAEHEWDVVFDFARGVAARLVESRPRVFTLAFEKSSRRGRILIDYKRNYRTSIAVAGFSLRAKPNAPISVPVAWAELGRLGGGDAFTAENIRARLARRADPWSGYWRAKQRLTRGALRAIGVAAK